MSRNTRARRLARKARPKLTIPEPSGTWGDGPPLTPDERARVWARYSDMRCRGFRFGFVPMFDFVFEARTPEELNEAVRQKLLATSKGKIPN
jgi:hypothetical protein